MCHLTEILSGVMFTALYFIALGTGGIKPCVSSFGADQFDETDKTQKTKKSSYFNWFYFSINVGTLIASTLLVYVQNNSGWALGFAIPAVAMVIAVFSLLFGTRLYRYQTPGRSPLSRISQVIVASFTKFQVHVPDDSTLLYETPPEVSAIHGSRKLEHTNGMRFLDKAAVTTSTLDDENNSKAPVNPWRLCTVTQVEELKSVIRLLLIWANCIIFTAVYGQMSTMFVLQGNTMDPKLGKFNIPSATLTSFDTISVLIWVLVYDKIIVHLVRKFIKRESGFTQLQRM